NINGCDSIVILNLTINTYHTDTTLATICNQDSFLFDGNYYTNAGIYTQSYSNQYGCDSILVLDLSVLPATPLPTVTSPIIYCMYDVPTSLIANGTALLWYT